MKVYPYGYTAYEAQITHLMQEHTQLVMIDTRFTPWSNRPEWRTKTLKATYGERYRWAGQYLGNLNYKNGGPICLADPAAGPPPAPRRPPPAPKNEQEKTPP